MPLSRDLLSTEAIHQKLQTLDGWRFEAGKLLKRFEFRDFVTAFGWMTEVALTAEKLDHHPDWTNVYRSVDVALQTHDAGGVTEYDFALARRMDACATPRAPSP